MADPVVRGTKKPSYRPTRYVGAPDAELARLDRVLAQLSSRMRKARRQFNRLTGHTAVISLRSSVRVRERQEPLSPPAHPRCAEMIPGVTNPPCVEQWQLHLRASHQSARVHSHTCPLGLRCSCVPIHVAGALVGVAKLVADSETPAGDFSSATGTLALVASAGCHEAWLSVLRDELRTLGTEARVRHPQDPPRARPAPSADAVEGAASAGTSAIVDRALVYLHEHSQEPDLTLRAVAASVGCNGKYLTHRFTQTVGQHMHAYLTILRVNRASLQLLQTDLPVKWIAAESGFGDVGQLVRAFHRHVGVTPSRYRGMFAPR